MRKDKKHIERHTRIKTIWILAMVFIPIFSAATEKWEQRMFDIQEEYEYGSYNKAALHLSKLRNQLSATNTILPKRLDVRMKLLRSRLYEARLHFRESEFEYGRARQQVLDVPTGPETFLEYLDFAVSTHRYIDAGEFLNEENRSKFRHSPFEAHRFTILLAEELIGEGFWVKATEELKTAERYWSQTPEIPAMDGESQAIVDLISKRWRARFMHAQLHVDVHNGQWDNIEKRLIEAKEWVKSALGSSDPAYSKLFLIEAEYWEFRHETDKQLEALNQAYFHRQGTEYQLDKLYILARMATLSLEANKTAAFYQHRRNLTLASSSMVGKFDLYHFAYNYVLAYELYYKGDFDKAYYEVEKLESLFDILPYQHRFRVLLTELKQKITLEGKDFSSFLNLLKEQRDKSITFLGAQTPALHEINSNIALFEISYGNQFEKAEEELRESYEQVIALHTGENSPIHQKFYRGMADLYFKTGRYAKALETSEKKVHLVTQLYGELSGQTAQATAQSLYYKLVIGEYKTVMKGLPGLLVTEQQVAWTPTMQNIRLELLYLIAELSQLTGDIEMARESTNRALKLLKFEEVHQSLEATATWEELALMYTKQGNYYKAEQLLIQSIELKTARLDSISPMYTTPFTLISRLYTSTGELGKADDYLERLAANSRALYGEESLSYAEARELRAAYYEEIGDFKKAEALYKEVLERYSKLLGAEHLILARTEMKLAEIESVFHPEKRRENEAIYLEVGRIIEKDIGRDNALFAEYLHDASLFYLHVEEYQKAEEMLKEANNYWVSRLGAENRYSAEVALMKGDVFYAQDRYEEAVSSYKKSKKIYEDIFSDTHPLYAESTEHLARAYYMLGDPDEAFSLISEVMPIYLDYTKMHFPSLSFSEKAKLWSRMKEDFEFYNFLMISHILEDEPSLSGEVYDMIISTKALLLSSDMKLRQQIQSSGDQELIALFNSWVEKKELITSLLSLTKSERSEQGVNLQDEYQELERLEKNMSSRSAAFGDSKAQETTTWKDIKKQLKAKEFAVEIFRYRHFDKVFTDSVLYAGLILNRENKEVPELVVFPNGSDMESRYYKYYRNAALYNVKDNFSYNVFWNPIGEKLPKGSTVYLSSDGIYNMMNPEILPDPVTGEYVIDKHELIFVTNTKDLNHKPESGEKSPSGAQAMMCGNPDFYNSEKSIKGLNPLPGTEKEVEFIHSIMSKNGRQPVLLTKGDVSEARLKAMKSPEIFHIATHGYFSDGGKGEHNHLISNPMLNSGLVVAGGGDILGDPSDRNVNRSDGILTAYEVVNMSLDNTKLVVLSACETARGKVQEGEGVFGLQRAFLIAGADAIIMSLFKVDDNVTTEFMSIFYETLLEKGNKNQAFREAKRKTKKTYPSPVDWGAFIMIEAQPKIESILN